jgi:mannose-6-phosphate isomerase-like protein (cupin superfamily)
MARPGDRHRYPGGVEMEVVVAAEASGDRALELLWHVPVGARLVALPHVHADVDEHFLIEAGTARHWLGRRRLLARAGDGWIVPAGIAHVHPGNVGEEPLVVRQWIQVDAPDPALLRGVERYFETVSSLAAQGRVDRFGRIKDPLQEAVTLSETLMPGTWFAGIPIPAQRALLERLAALGRRRGRVAEPSPL